MISIARQRLGHAEVATGIILKYYYLKLSYVC